VMRGPIVYCIEGADNPAMSALDVKLAADPKSPERTFARQFEPDFLAGSSCRSRG